MRFEKVCCFLRGLYTPPSFNSIPIRSKFLLFSLGVFFWFFLLFAVNFLTLSGINTKTDYIVSVLIPRDRAVGQTAILLRELSLQARDLLNEMNPEVFENRTAATAKKVATVKRQFPEVDSTEENPEEKLSGHLDPVQQKFGIFRAYKKAALSGRPISKQQVEDAMNAYLASIATALAATDEFTSDLDHSAAAKAQSVSRTVLMAGAANISMLLLITVLLFFCTRRISGSIATPLTTIAEEIRELARGRIDFTRTLNTNTNDEIGALCHEFNGLMESISSMSTFKKVIEEDESLVDVYVRLADAIQKRAKIPRFTIFEISDSQHRMKIVYPLDMNEQNLPCNHEILNNSSLCKVKSCGHEISSAAYPRICRQYRETGTGHVCMPMISSGVMSGVVQFLVTDGVSEENIHCAHEYVIQSIPVIETKRLTNTLRESALKDSLTGLYNRRFLQEYAESLVAGITRRKARIGLIMCDLDFFKQVNDLHGHHAGDIVLRETAEVLKGCVRSVDLVIRYGGEEFLVVLQDVEGGMALQIAEKIRAQVCETKIHIANAHLHRTISLGVSEFPSDTESFWQAVQCADVALYRAKEEGRDRAVRFVSEMSPAPPSRRAVKSS